MQGGSAGNLGFPPVFNRIPSTHEHPNAVWLCGFVVIPKAGLMFLNYFWFGPGTAEHHLKAKGALLVHKFLRTPGQELMEECGEERERKGFMIGVG